MMQQNKGITKFILIFIIVAFLLSYFGINLEEIFNSSFVEKINVFWITYIKPVFILSLQTISAILQKIISAISSQA